MHHEARLRCEEDKTVVLIYAIEVAILAAGK
jgi:hypothetical protein